MGALKAHEVDDFVERLASEGPPFCTLAYGPDRGHVSDTVSRICAALRTAADDAFAVTTLDAGTVAADPGRLWDELAGPGLFGGGQIVRLREAGGDKRLADVIAALLSDPPDDAHLVIEGGDLRRSTALVKAVETSRAALALPCYADDERTIERVIDRTMRENGLTLDDGARAELTALLGGDRRATLAELEKLALFAGDESEVTLDHVRAVLGDGSALSVDEVVDGALMGDRARLERAYARLLAARTSPFLVLRDLAQQLFWIERAQSEAGGRNGAPARRKLAQVAGRRVHFRRMPALERAAETIPSETVREHSRAVTKGLLDSRMRPTLEAEAVGRICQEIARTARPDRP